MKKFSVSSLSLISGLTAMLALFVAYVPHTIAAEIHAYDGDGIQAAIVAATDGDVIVEKDGVTS